MHLYLYYFSKNIKTLSIVAVRDTPTTYEKYPLFTVVTGAGVVEGVEWAATCGTSGIGGGIRVSLTPSKSNSFIVTIVVVACGHVVLIQLKIKILFHY